MKAHEFTELLTDTYKGFSTLNVTMDNGEEAEFNDGTIYYCAKGYYYYIRAHGYKVGNARSYSDNMTFSVTIFCKRIVSIDCT